MQDEANNKTTDAGAPPSEGATVVAEQPRNPNMKRSDAC